MPTLLDLIDQVTPEEIDRQLADLDAAFAEIKRKHDERRGKLLRLAKTIGHEPAGARKRRARAEESPPRSVKTEVEAMRERCRQRLQQAGGKAVSLGELARAAGSTAAATARMLASQPWARKAGDRLWVYHKGAA